LLDLKKKKFSIQLPGAEILRKEFAKLGDVDYLIAFCLKKILLIPLNSKNHPSWQLPVKFNSKRKTSLGYSQSKIIDIHISAWGKHWIFK